MIYAYLTLLAIVLIVLFVLFSPDRGKLTRSRCLFVAGSSFVAALYNLWAGQYTYVTILLWANTAWFTALAFKYRPEKKSRTGM